MQVLLWLAPAGVVLVLAMTWAGVRGHAAGRVLDRDEAVRRLGEALERPAPSPQQRERLAQRPVDRSASVVVRRPRPARVPRPATEVPAVEVPTAPPARRTEPPAAPTVEPERRSA